jgi:hypothetical protein
MTRRYMLCLLWYVFTCYNIMIAGIHYVLAEQLKTNTPHYIHFF